MPRFLSVRERVVDDSVREEYLADATARIASAASAGVHLWVFVHQHDASRFIEFTEGASETVVGTVAGAPDDLWRNIED